MIRNKIIAATACTLFFIACDQPQPTAPARDLEPAFGRAGHGPAQLSQRKLNKHIMPLALYPLDPDRAMYNPYQQNLVQTFTAPRDGVFTFLYMPIACASGVQVEMQIREGGPDGTLLLHITTDPATTIARGAFLTFQMGATGVPVTSGSTYAIVLSSFPVTGQEMTCSIIAGPSGDSYAGGQAYMNNPGPYPNVLGGRASADAGRHVRHG